MSQFSLTLPVLASLIDELPLGVVVLDASAKVLLYNRYEEVLACRRRENVLGRSFFREVAPCMNVRDLGLDFSRRIRNEPLCVECEFEFPLPFLEKPRDVALRLVSFDTGADRYACLFVEDISARRAVERMKRTLGDLLVHDLKSPLAAALSSLSLLQQSPAVQQEREARELTQAAMGAGRRLERMVMNLLQITRIETASLEPVWQRVNVVAIAQQAMHELGAVAQMRGLRLQLDSPLSALEATLDPDLLRRGLDNLLDNAMRYSPPDARVTVRIDKVGTALCIEVEDRGPGIPDELREEIFAHESRGNEPVDILSSHRGLGLSFVRLMARLHGGEVGVRPAKPTGAVFWLHLPLEPPPAPDVSAPQLPAQRVLMRER